MIGKRPWQGYGLGGFWRGINGPSAFVELAVNAQVAYAHNGYLEMLISMGVPGLSAFAAAFIHGASRAFNWFRRTASGEGYWPMMFLTYLLFSNMAEGSITQMNNHLWAMFSATYFSLIMITSAKSRFR
jgi:O-antigen ligase